MKKTLSLLFVVALLSGCSDVRLAKFNALGSPGAIKCYSGDLLIFDGRSTGKISDSEQSDGYYFMDKESGKLVEVSGNCVIRYDT